MWFDSSDRKGDFVVTSNGGRVVYIVYSLFTIPIMTILISLMSDIFLSKFIKYSERFGVKGGDEQIFLNGQSRERAPKQTQSTRRSFQRKGKKHRSEKDIERSVDVSSVEDEAPQEEILKEVA